MQFLFVISGTMWIMYLYVDCACISASNAFTVTIRSWMPARRKEFGYEFRIKLTIDGCVQNKVCSILNQANFVLFYCLKIVWTYVQIYLKYSCWRVLSCLSLLSHYLMQRLAWFITWRLVSEKLAHGAHCAADLIPHTGNFSWIWEEGGLLKWLILSTKFPADSVYQIPWSCLTLLGSVKVSRRCDILAFVSITIGWRRYNMSLEAGWTKRATLIRTEPTLARTNLCVAFAFVSVCPMTIY